MTRQNSILRTPAPRASTGLLTGAGRERSVPLRGRITRQVASCCIARLLVLATEDPQRPIVIYIDSPGGSVSDSLSILSTMNGIRSPIATFCRGQAGGTAAIIAAHGRRGFRLAAPGAHFSFEAISAAAAFKPVPDGEESYLHLLVEMLAKAAQRTEAEALRWLSGGIRFVPQEAVEYGLIDGVSKEPLLPSGRISV
jgi:ATP-dependent Clp protease, protease subunit